MLRLTRNYVPSQILARRLLQTSQAGFTSHTQTEIKFEDVKKEEDKPNQWSRHAMPSARSFKDLLKKQEPVKVPEPVKVQETPKKRVRRSLKPRKALITLSPNAVSHLRALLDQPTPQLIRIGVRNRGCSGLSYNLEYIEQPNKFDEIVEQDGVKVVIDSKALFSIVGSEMDWLDDKLSSRFIFKNPNSKGTCGCGESFMV